MSNSESLNFLNPDQCRDIKAKVGTPCFVYDEATLKRQATTALSFPNAYGLTVRFAMKASPKAAILKSFDTLGLHIDASSGFVVRRAVAAAGGATGPAVPPATAIDAQLRGRVARSAGPLGRRENPKYS